MTRDMFTATPDAAAAFARWHDDPHEPHDYQPGVDGPARGPLHPAWADALAHLPNSLPDEMAF